MYSLKLIYMPMRRLNALFFGERGGGGGGGSAGVFSSIEFYFESELELEG